jgi:3'-5' exoribonuclease
MHYKIKPNQTTNQLNMPIIKTPFKGTFRIANKKTGMSKNGDKYVTYELHDANSIKEAICIQNAISWSQNKPYELVNVKGHMVYGSEKNILQIKEIEPVNTMDNPIQRLSKALAVNPNDLDRLLNLRQNIRSPALGQFIDTIFSEDDIAFSFLQVPASRNHHHNDAGGLLAHSLEAAEIVAALPYEKDYEQEIAIVAALLHDIGKVSVFNINGTYTKLGKMVNHDALTLKVCATALKALDDSWRDASYTLQHAWTCASSGSKNGFKPMCSIASKVRYADNQSCKNYDIQKSFKTKLVKTGLIWSEHKEQYFWRPAAEPRQLNGAKYA